MSQFTTEIEWLRRKVESDPGSVLFARLADNYLELDEVQRAIEIAQSGLSANPNYVTAKYVLAKCYYKRQEFDRAASVLKEALNIDPQHLASLSLQSELLRKIGHVDDARTNYQQILNVDPVDSLTLSRLKELEENGHTDYSEPFEDDYTADFSAPAEPSPWDEDTEPDEEPFEPDTEPAESYQPFADKDRSEPDNPFDDFSTSETEQDFEEQTSNVPDLDIDDFEVDRSKYQQEGEEFTKILDDIFSDSLDEEKRQEEETRNTIEQIAQGPDQAGMDSSKDRSALAENFYKESETEERDEEPPFEAADEDEDEDLTPEEKILNSAQLEDEFFQHGEEPFQEDDEGIPEEFVSFEQGEQEPQPEQKSDNQEDEFSRFLSSLDIKEGDDTDWQLRDRDKSDLEKNWDDFEEDESDTESDAWGFADDEKNVQQMFDGEESLSFDDEEVESEQDESKEEPTLSTEGAYDSSEKFVTPTLGEIYAAQGQYAKAIHVFETLMKKNPDNEWYQQKIEQLQKRLDEENQD